MSTKLTPRRPVTKAKRRYQAALEQELARAQGRVRSIDAVSAFLVLVVAALGYVAVVVLLDHLFRFPDGLRQAALALLGLGGLGYILYALVLPMRREVNPYFAARALERSSPDSKNALINWLDLRSEPLPGVIREAVQRQAVDELDQADVEQAIPSRRPMRLFYALAGLFVVFVALWLLLPQQFPSLLARALFPFSSTAVPTSTRFKLVSPIADEVSEDPLNDPVQQIPVEPGVPVSIATLIEGRVPQSVLLEYQPTLAEKPRTRALARPADEERRLPWSTNLTSDMVPADGLYFRLRGGDGVSRQYQLVVASKKPPSVADVEVLYTYPRYTARPPKRQNHAPLKALIGTKAEISFVADQPVRTAMLEVQGQDRILRSQALTINREEADPRLRERVVRLPEPLLLGSELRGKASYTVTLQGKEGKADTSPAYAIEVEEDAKPIVTIEKIGQEVLQPEQKEVRLPQNDVTAVLGRVRDDIAVQSARLRLRTLPKEGPAAGRDLFGLGVKDRETGLQKANGYAPPPTDYQLTLDLTKLTDQAKPTKETQPLLFQVGDRLELWVEATDGCEPEPNTGASPRLTLILTEPLQKEDQEQKQKDNQEQEQQRDKDRKEKQEKEDGENGKVKPEQNNDQKPGEDKKPSDDKPMDKKPGDDKPMDKKPGDDEPMDKKPGDDKPMDKKPGDDKPMDKKPGDDKPMDKKPGDDKPMAKKPGDDKPMDKKPGDDKPMDKKPGDDKPMDKKPGDDKPMDKKPGDDKPMDKKPGDDKPMDKKPGDDKPMDKKPGDDKPMDKKPGEDKKPSDDKPMDKKPGEDKKPSDDKPMDKKPGEDKKPSDDKPMDKKPGEDKKPSDDKPMDKKPGEDKKPSDDKPMDKKPGEDKKPSDDKPMDKKPGEDKKPSDDKPMDKKPGDDKPMDKKPGDDKPNAADQKRDEETQKKADELAKAIQNGQGDKKPEERGDPPSPPKVEPDAINKEDAQRAKDLLLDTFKQKMDRGEIDKDVLKKMNWTEQEAKEFVKQYEASKNQRLRGSGGKAAGASRDATTIRGGGDAVVDDPNRPPDEIRDYFERVRRRQAEAGVKKK